MKNSILLSLFLLVSISLTSCEKKGTKEHPSEDERDWGKLTHLKYNLYQSEYQNKKTIVEQMNYFAPEYDEYYRFYTDEFHVVEPKKSVMLTYSLVLDLPTYTEIKGTAYAYDKNKVYFLDTIRSRRTAIYYADPKTFKTLSYNTAEDKNYVFENQDHHEKKKP